MKLRSETVIKDGALYSVTYGVADECKKAVADTLSGTLEDHGFKRTGKGGFERAFPAGKLTITVLANDLDDQHVGVNVMVGVSWFLTRRLLAAMADVQGSYMPKAPAVASPLQLLASGSPGTQALFADQAPGEFALVVSDRAEAEQRARQELIPMLAVVTDQAIPWFENPRFVIEQCLALYLDKGHEPAGFQFICMEDLILARLTNARRFDELAARRIEREQAYASKAASSNRSISAEGMDRVYRHTRANLRPNAWLCSPASADRRAGAQVVNDLNWSLLLIGSALALKLVSLLMHAYWPTLSIWSDLAFLLSLPLSGVAIYSATGFVFRNIFSKTALLIAVLLPRVYIDMLPPVRIGSLLLDPAMLPPVYLVMLVYLAWRIWVIRGGLQALLAPPGPEFLLVNT